MKRALLPLALFSLSSLGFAQTPDVHVYSIGDAFGSSDVSFRGQFDGIVAFAIATQSCNSGTGLLDWFASPDVRHPVIAQNMFRLKGGRFEQIGQSWLKHAFCAVNETESECGPCGGTPCTTLGVGCADTYTSGLNDGAFGGSKRFVNAATGGHVEGSPSPVGNSAIRGRLQVHVPDLDPAMNPGAAYFIEGHYVTADDAAAGADENNASWRRVTVNSVTSVVVNGPTIREQAAIFAWQNDDPSVTIVEVPNRESEGGRTVFYLGYKVTDLGNGLWQYEYAIQNLNSDQSANSFRVDVGGSTSVSNIGFHDVDYHSGDPYDLTDWGSSVGAGSVTWSTDDFATNENANALRWGTLYNFRFTADAGPATGTATLGLFKPDLFTELTVPALAVPGESGSSCANPAAVAVRNGGSNIGTYAATLPISGGTLNLSVTADYDFGVVLAYGAPASIPLANGQVVLFDPSSAYFFTAGLSGLPNGSTTQNVPTNLGFCGLTAYTQVLLTGPTAGGPTFQFTNSRDLTIGF